VNVPSLGFFERRCITGAANVRSTPNDNDSGGDDNGNSLMGFFCL
jgi:hypothetical protein